MNLLYNKKSANFQPLLNEANLPGGICQELLEELQEDSLLLVEGNLGEGKSLFCKELIEKSGRQTLVIDADWSLTEYLKNSSSNYIPLLGESATIANLGGILKLLEDNSEMLVCIDSLDFFMQDDGTGRLNKLKQLQKLFQACKTNNHLLVLTTKGGAPALKHVLSSESSVWICLEKLGYEVSTSGQESLLLEISYKKHCSGNSKENQKMKISLN